MAVIASIQNAFDEIDPTDLERLIESGKNADTRKAEIGGTYAQEVKEFCENKNFHKKAISMLKSIDKMSDTKREDFMRSLKMGLEHYEEVWRGRNTADMFDGDAA